MIMSTCFENQFCCKVAESLNTDHFTSCTIIYCTGGSVSSLYILSSVALTYLKDKSKVRGVLTRFPLKLAENDDVGETVI